MVERNELLENVKLTFRNFRGLERTDSKGRIVNAAGKRNFSVILDEAMAEDLDYKGWNVKRSEYDGMVRYTLPVTVAFTGRPPKILMKAEGESKGVVLSEDTVGQLDYSDILRADLIIRPYNWEVNGQTGVKAYLRSMEVTIYVDPIEARMQAEEEDMSW